MSCKAKCELPDLFCDMIECDRCSAWFHKICGETSSNDCDKWFCTKCITNVKQTTRRIVKKPKVMDL